MPTLKAASTSPPLPLFAITEMPYNIPAQVAALIPMYILRRQGMSIEQSSAITALCILPSGFYFLYAPVVDFFFRRKTWFLLALGIASVLVVLAFLTASTDHVRLLTAFLFAADMTSMLLSAATGGLMSTLLDRSQKARVGAWVQAGSLGGSTLGFGLLAWLVPHVSRPVLALTSLLLMLPGLAVLFFNEPALPEQHEKPVQVILASLRELQATFFTTRNLPALVLLIVPIGTGALTTVLTGLTADYGASAAQLAFANGVGGGLCAAAGALCVLLFPVRWDRMVAYTLTAIIYGIVSFAIAASPARSITFITGMLLANFVGGITFAAYTGVLLQVVKTTGRVQGSSYSILNSIGNLPIIYMTWLEGQAAGHFGARSIGVLDGATNFLVAGGFFLWWFLSGRRELGLSEGIRKYSDGSS